MPTWDDVVEAAAALPGVEETTTYGAAPALKVRGKIVCWLRPEPRALVVPVTDIAEKEALLADDRGHYFTIPHYDGHAHVLVRLETIPERELAELLEDSWRLSATKRSIAAFDAERADAGSGEGSVPTDADAGSAGSSACEGNAS